MTCIKNTDYPIKHIFISTKSCPRLNKQPLNGIDGVKKSDAATVHVLGHVAACLSYDVVHMLNLQRRPNSFPSKPWHCCFLWSYVWRLLAHLYTTNSLTNSLTLNTKILAIAPFSSPCSSLLYCRETSIYIIQPWVSKEGIFHFDFPKMNSELGATTLCSGELNTRLEVRAVLLPALQLSFHITLRKSLHLMLL